MFGKRNFFSGQFTTSGTSSKDSVCTGIHLLLVLPFVAEGTDVQEDHHVPVTLDDVFETLSLFFIPLIPPLELHGGKSWNWPQNVVFSSVYTILLLAQDLEAVHRPIFRDTYHSMLRVSPLTSLQLMGFEERRHHWYCCFWKRLTFRFPCMRLLHRDSYSNVMCWVLSLQNLWTQHSTSFFSVTACPSEVFTERATFIANPSCISRSWYGYSE